MAGRRHLIPRRSRRARCPATDDLSCGLSLRQETVIALVAGTVAEGMLRQMFPYGNDPVHAIPQTLSDNQLSIFFVATRQPDKQCSTVTVVSVPECRSNHEASCRTKNFIVTDLIL